MLRRSIFAVVVVSAMVACAFPNRESASPPGPGQVAMKLSCLSDGTLGFSLTPWAVRLPNKNAEFVWINDPKSNADGTITAQNPQYPFGGQTYTAAHGASIHARPVKDTPADTYKYSVTVICPKSGGGSDTTVVDPDMIIPWKIERN